MLLAPLNRHAAGRKISRVEDQVGRRFDRNRQFSLARIFVLYVKVRLRRFILFARIEETIGEETNLNVVSVPLEFRALIVKKNEPVGETIEPRRHNLWRDFDHLPTFRRLRNVGVRPDRTSFAEDYAR